MDNQRLFAWALFGLMLLMTWQQWQEDYGPQPPTATLTPADTEAAPDLAPPADPTMAVPDLADTPAVEPGTETDTPVLNVAPAPAQPLISVRTDVLELSIDPVGGDIVAAALPRYPVDKDSPDVTVSLLSRAPADFAAFRTGLTTRNKNDEPNHHAAFRAEQTEYTLASGEDTLVVPLVWQGADGVTVTKQYTLRRGRYGIDLQFIARNDGEAAWDAAPYARIVHIAEPPQRSMFDVESYSFNGPVTFDGERYDKHSLGDLEDGAVSVEASGGAWVAAIEHHFLSAIVPPADEPVTLQAQLPGEQFLTGYVGAPLRVAPGASADRSLTLFVGPKLQDQLRAISPRLPLTVDYGFLTLLADPLFWLLSKIYDLVGNWGWAIILVTVLIKLVFYKLTEQSGRSMAKMRNLAPRMKSLQERYKDDRQKLSEAMMDLYKREKVNPAAGCLPILVQMPVFLAFYWVLLESVEMRQAPFMLWIQDLSSRDPLFILPLLMGASMLAQQQLNPAPADPVQARVMKILPVIFTVFFAFFPAGLVLYWFTNTILGVAQQWQVNRIVAREEQKKRD